jgi:hypothetical protein
MPTTMLKTTARMTKTAEKKMGGASRTVLQTGSTEVASESGSQSQLKITQLPLVGPPQPPFF